MLLDLRASQNNNEAEGGSCGRINVVQRRADSLSSVNKQRRETRPLSPLRMKDTFQFVPKDEKNDKVKILEMLIVFKFFASYRLGVSAGY